MKVVIAPDSFKESMTAVEASQAIQRGIKRYDSCIETLLYPLADGGEGTLETLITSMQGTIEYNQVTGPCFEKIQAPIGYIGHTAVIECAKVCGLELLEEHQKDPNYTTTYGLGELILHALTKPVDKIMICLGGSATNDGGIGMLSAIGARFLNQQGESVTLTMKGLSEIDSIDLTSLHQRIDDVKIIGICDVTNPLCGQQGATYIYGPQKGVKQDEREMIDQAMQNYAHIVDQHFHKPMSQEPGTGAAGGLGYAIMAVCQGNLQPGFKIVCQTLGLEKAIQSCDLVIVGEGKIDRQTEFGKTPYGVLQIAQKYHKNVYAFAGIVEDYKRLKTLGFLNVYSIKPSDMPLSMAIKKGKDNLEKCVYEHMEEIINEL